MATSNDIMSLLKKKAKAFVAAKKNVPQINAGLPVGDYIAKLKLAKVDKTSTGKLCFRWSVRVTEPEDLKGQKHRFQHMMETEQNIGYLLAALKLFGYEIEDLDMTDLVKIAKELTEAQPEVKISVRAGKNGTNTYLNEVLDTVEGDDEEDSDDEEEKPSKKSKKSKADDEDEEEGDEEESEEDTDEESDEDSEDGDGGESDEEEEGDEDEDEDEKPSKKSKSKKSKKADDDEDEESEEESEDEDEEESEEDTDEEGDEDEDEDEKPAKKGGKSKSKKSEDEDDEEESEDEEADEDEGELSKGDMVQFRPDKKNKKKTLTGKVVSLDEKKDIVKISSKGKTYTVSWDQLDGIVAD